MADRPCPDRPCPRCGQHHDRCTGHSKTSGGPCRLRPLTNQRVCHLHGGKSPQALTAAKRRGDEQKARAVMTALGIPATDTNPTQALLDLIHAKAGEVAWLRTKVQELDDGDLVWGKTVVLDKGSGEFPGTDTTSEAKPVIWWAMLRTAEDQLANYCTKALTAGIEERRVRLAESQGALVAEAIRRILAALDLSPSQMEQVPVVVPQILRTIEQGAA